MDRNKVIRGALWASVPFNLLAAAMLAFPSSALGQLAGLPTPVPLVYCVVLAYFVAMFGGMYAWLAQQPVIHRPLVAMSAIGKAGVFAIMVLLWSAGEVPLNAVLLTVGDLAFAGVFGWWLSGVRTSGIA